MGKFQVKADMSSAIDGLNRLGGPIKESLARRMGVSGGVVLRDEAKRNAAERDIWSITNPLAASRGSTVAGTLAKAIYLALDTDNTNAEQVVYKVSWNAKDAWWGKLVEFGYRPKYKIAKDKHGNWFTLHDENGKPIPLPSRGERVGAYPFLGPAYDAKLGQARRDMIARGKEELPKLLRGG